MNQEQAQLAIRNAVRLENLSNRVAAKITPELIDIYRWVTQQIAALPAGEVERQLAYRQLQLQLADLFGPINGRFYQQLQQALGSEVTEQIAFARRYLEEVGPVPASGALSVSAPSVALPAGGAAAIQPPPVAVVGAARQFTQTQLTALVDDTEVLGRRLGQLFGVGGETPGSAWVKDNITAIDRTVKRGFLLGQTNEQIAKQLPGTGAKQIAVNRTVARTAVMDMSQRAHERFWDANDSVIAGWEFDGSMDYRMCSRCAPWNGRTAELRSSLPRAPLHANCRCRVLPLTETELALRKEEGPQTRSTVQLVEAKSKEEALAKARSQTPGAVDARAYSRKVRDPQTGKMMWKVAIDIKQPGRTPTTGDFLLKATPETRRNVLGSKKAEERFMDLVTGRKGTAPMSPDQALQRVLPLAAANDGKPADTRGPRQSPAVRRIPQRNGRQ